MHPLIDRQHGGDHDAEGGGAAPVEMADQGDDGRDHGYADHVVTYQLHELADDHIEHARIGHDAEIQHGEHEQGGGGAGAGEAGLDHGGQVVEGVAARDHQDKPQDGRKDDEGDGGLGLTAEQGHHDGYDGDESQDADDDVTHR